MNDVTEGHDGAGAQKAMCHTSSHGVHDTLTACDGPEAPEARDELPEKLPEKAGVNDTFVRQEPRQLIPGARVVFGFDSGHAMGTYLGPSKRKQDKHKELHYVQWDDGSNVKVQLNDMRHYDGEDVAGMEPGQWMIVGMAKTMRFVGNVIADETIDDMVYMRDYYEETGMLAPAFAASKQKKADPDSGPFTLNQVMRRDDWPEFEKAAETELDTIERNETWTLCDENEAYNQGAYVYDTRFVFTKKRTGKHKGRLVLRGDQQQWPGWDDDFEPGELESMFGDVSDDKELGTDAATFSEMESLVNEAYESSKRAAADAAATGGDETDGRHFCPATTPLSGETGDSDLGVDLSVDASIFPGEHAFGMLSTKVANTYRQLFSPVMTQTVMMLLLAVAVANNE